MVARSTFDRHRVRARIVLIGLGALMLFFNGHWLVDEWHRLLGRNPVRCGGCMVLGAILIGLAMIVPKSAMRRWCCIWLRTGCTSARNQRGSGAHSRS
jgi:hypothetical protein